MPASTLTRSAATVAGSWRQDYLQRLFRHAPGDHDPVVLRHRRIYILPTRRGIAFLATLGMALLTSLNYSLSLGFVATFMLVGLMSAALVHTFRNLSGIELRPLAAGETFAGAVMPFTLVLAGGATPRYAITLGARGCLTVTVDVVPDAALPVALELLTPRRGRIVLGRITLSSNFPLGLWRAWAYVHFPLAGIAFPTPEIGPPPLPKGDAGQDEVAVARGADADLAGLRTYQPGDPLQRVAWKAVARGAGWHSKQFEGGGGGGPVNLAWDSLPAALGPQARIARLTAWVLAAERAARPFALIAPGVALAAGQGREHRRAALTALALMPEQDAAGSPEGVNGSPLGGSAAASAASVGVQ
jgi:uncharacterized protein (DUF58 family)